MQNENSLLPAVKNFWEKTPCGEHFADSEKEGSDAYFRVITQQRYRWEYHLHPFLDETASAGRKILEVGCGMGIDASELALRGREVTGLDLTKRGIDLARRNFERLGLQGTFVVGNAEALPFADATFDVVYSMGVLHHTPQIAKSLSEVQRVLKPGGKAFIMLYSRYSLNRLAHLILRLPYEKSEEAVEDAPVTQVFSEKELRSLFSSYTEVSFRKRYLFGYGWKPVCYFVPRFLNDLLGRLFGWHWLIVARRPTR